MRKVAISIDPELLSELDGLVARQVFASRREAIRMAVEEKLSRLRRGRLARECARLRPAEERVFAEVGSGASGFEFLRG